MQVHNFTEADGSPDRVAEWKELRFQRRPKREAEQLAGEFTPAVDRFEPPAGMRFVRIRPARTALREMAVPVKLRS